MQFSPVKRQNSLFHESAILILLRPLDQKRVLLNKEMKLLVQSADYYVIKGYSLPEKNTSYLFSPSSLEIIKEEFSTEIKPDVIIIGDHLDPKQLMNLELLFETRVIDKYELVLEIFASRAQTTESKLQIQLAHIKYEKPRERLRLLNTLGIDGSWHSEREGFFSTGEAPMNLFEARMTKNESIIRKKLENVKTQRIRRRSKRKNKNRESLNLSIVGYTSAGKSTVLNSLTQSSSAVVSPRLFETLDTKVRSITIDDLLIFVTDTVGFIEDLPTFLIDSFKSTLEESLDSDILLVVIDSSDDIDSIIMKTQTTFQILSEGNSVNNKVLILNKIDLISTEKLKKVLNYFKKEKDYEHIPIIPVSAKNDIQPILKGLDFYNLIPKLKMISCKYDPNYSFRSFIYNNYDVKGESFDILWQVEFSSRKGLFTEGLLLKKAKEFEIVVEVDIG